MAGFRFRTLLQTIVVGVALTAAPAQAQQACDGACLNGFADRYIAAMIAHDVSRVPLADDVRISENGAPLQPGEGLWRTASGDSAYRLYVPDPATGQVGFIGVIRESGVSQLMALRLRVANGEITEVETVIAREQREGNGNAFFNPAWFDAPLPIFSERLSRRERRSREEMIAAADAYFNGIVAHTGEAVPFDDDCSRHENGVLVIRSEYDGHIEGEAPLSCREQLNQGFAQVIERVRDRRYFVDEERGLVFANLIMEYSGNVAALTLANGRVLEMPPSGRYPLALYAGDVFKIKNGRIVQMEAIYIKLPYGAASIWAE